MVVVVMVSGLKRNKLNLISPKADSQEDSGWRNERT